MPPDCHPDQKLKELIESCGAHLRGELVNNGATVAALCPQPPQRPTASQLQAVYDTTCLLCDEGNYAFACTLALHLVTHQVTDPRFTFIAATCLQRLGIFANAAQLFGFSLVHGAGDPVTLLRFGECLLAVGDRENAAKALDAAFDPCRADENALAVQVFAGQFIESMNQRARSATAAPSPS